MTLDARCRQAEGAEIDQDLDDAQLETLLFPPPPTIAADQRPMPDWAWVLARERRAY